MQTEAVEVEVVKGGRAQAHAWVGDDAFRIATGVALCGYVDRSGIGKLLVDGPLANACPICVALWKERMNLL